MIIRTVAVITLLVIDNTLSAEFGSKFISDTPPGIYDKAGVATNGPNCSTIGTNVLKRNGSAVDAAIAALLCEGIASPQSMGLGGGFFMTIYDSSTQTATFLDARETAPSLASSIIFDKESKLSSSSSKVAVPGELLGYWEAHQKYGRLPWKELFEPTIELCKTGITITKYVEKILVKHEKILKDEPTMKEIFINPLTDKVYKAGEKMKRPKLAKTLTLLAEDKNPVQLFYNGTIRDSLVKEIIEFDGIMTPKDFSTYSVKWKEPIEAKLGNMTILTAPPPGSGLILTLFLNIFEDHLLSSNKTIMWQRLLENLKHAIAQKARLGDPDFVDIKDVIEDLKSVTFAKTIQKSIKDDITYNDPRYYNAVRSIKDDSGTAHISVIAPDGSAVSVTSTTNSLLGAKIRSKSTGIIFNDELNDFEDPFDKEESVLPPSSTNLIEPGKRPMSSMAPTIVLNGNKNVQLAIGAAGGTYIVSALATILLLFLKNNYNIKEAIDARRLYHTKFEKNTYYEKGFSLDVLDYLRSVGHNLTELDGIGSTAIAVANVNGQVIAYSDYRRQGTVAGF